MNIPPKYEDVVAKLSLEREEAESTLGELEDLVEKLNNALGEVDALQQRLTVAEKLLRETSDYLDGSTRNAVWCDSILHKKMKAALKPAEEGEGS